MGGVNIYIYMYIYICIYIYIHVITCLFICSSLCVLMNYVCRVLLTATMGRLVV